MNIDHIPGRYTTLDEIHKYIRLYAICRSSGIPDRVILQAMSHISPDGYTVEGSANDVWIVDFRQVGGELESVIIHDGKIHNHDHDVYDDSWTGYRSRGAKSVVSINYVPPEQGDQLKYHWQPSPVHGHYNNAALKYVSYLKDHEGFMNERIPYRDTYINVVYRIF